MPKHMAGKQRSRRDRTVDRDEGLLALRAVRVDSSRNKFFSSATRPEDQNVRRMPPDQSKICSQLPCPSRNADDLLKRHPASISTLLATHWHAFRPRRPRGDTNPPKFTGGFRRSHVALTRRKRVLRAEKIDRCRNKTLSILLPRPQTRKHMTLFLNVTVVISHVIFREFLHFKAILAALMYGFLGKSPSVAPSDRFGPPADTSPHTLTGIDPKCPYSPLDSFRGREDGGRSWSPSWACWPLWRPVGG